MRFKGLLKAAGEYECAFEVRICPFVKQRSRLPPRVGNRFSSQKSAFLPLRPSPAPEMREDPRNGGPAWGGQPSRQDTFWERRRFSRL